MSKRKRIPFVSKASRITASDIVAVIAVLMTLASMVMADRMALRIDNARLRLEASRKVGEISALMQAEMAGQANLIEGLGAAIGTTPDIDHREFESLSANLIAQSADLHSLAIARDLKIEMVYPLKGNEEALGIDYRQRPDQLGSVRKALETEQAVVDGPIHLTQGGSALVVYVPLSKIATDQRNWGVLSAVYDLDQLLRDAVMAVENSDFRIAVAAINNQGAPVDVLLGQADLFEEDPVIQTLPLGQQDWAVAIAPRKGWNATTTHTWRNRAGIIAVGFMVIASILWTAWLTRQKTIFSAKLRNREQKLARLSHRMQMALDAGQIGIWEYDVTNNKTYWDERMYTLYGIQPDKYNKPDLKLWASRVHPDDVERELDTLKDVIEKEASFHSTFRVLHDDGTEYYIRVQGGSYRDDSGSLHVIGVNWDVTHDIKLEQALKSARTEIETRHHALLQAHEKLKFNALHDSLTGLPNRRHIEETFVQGDGGPDSRPPYVVMHIDLDRFKEINDTMGHAAGDALLRHTARMLLSLARPGDFVARVGSDEFLVISHWNNDPEAISKRALEIVNALGKPLPHKENLCRISASIGIAWMDDENGMEMNDVLINADIALHEAKRLGRNRYFLFNHALRSAAVAKKNIADEILIGLEKNQFFVCFQPQVNLRTGELAGVETLVRWRHPRLGVLAPDAFIATAEMTGAMAHIDKLVLSQAAQHFNKWKEHGVDIPKLSVNLSAQRLEDDMLLAEIETLGLPAGVLCFELVESISFDGEGVELEERVRKIKDHGIDIEIDDFGTGYASIVSLLQLSPHRLKIDRKLVEPLASNNDQGRLIASIVEIGRSLGIEIIAEGIETVEQAEKLRRLGCTTGQGYLISKPLDAEGIEAFVRTRAWENRLSIRSSAP